MVVSQVGTIEETCELPEVFKTSHRNWSISRLRMGKALRRLSQRGNHCREGKTEATKLNWQDPFNR